MTTKLQSIKKRDEFKKIASQGKKWVTRSFVIQVCPNNQDIQRYGVTATKKTVGNAVHRNRAKRRLRALIRNILSTHAQTGIDCVFIARKDILSISNDQLTKDLLWALKRLEYRV